MEFEQTEPDQNYPILKYVCKEANYEVGLCPVLFGVRVRAGRAGSQTCDIDYCAGDSASFQKQLLLTVLFILMRLPEDVSSNEIRNMLPTFEVKPINLDPCWTKLKDLALKLGSSENLPCYLERLKQGY